MAENTSFPMHVYPNFITLPQYKNRCMRILVKEMATVNGGSDKLVKEAMRKNSEFTAIADNYGNLWKQGRKVSDIKTTQVDKNIKKISQAYTIYAIALPLPNELMDAQSHRWDPEKGAVATIGGGFLDKADVNISGKRVSDLVAEASSVFGFRKNLLDPGFYQNYTSSAPRNFSFTFDLIPNNAAEADAIMNIVLNLKKFSLPTSTISGVSLLAPFTFEIDIGNEKLKKLINMNDVVLTEISVNYSGDGSMQMFSNGVPKFIQLNLSFAEKSVITAEFYD